MNHNCTQPGCAARAAKPEQLDCSVTCASARALVRCFCLQPWWAVIAMRQLLMQMLEDSAGMQLVCRSTVASAAALRS